MLLTVQSLASLASGAVLIHQLDTRELPLHLHEQMEQYKRRKGAFTLLSMDLELERMDGGKVSKEEWKNTVRRFDQSDTGRAYMQFGVVFSRLGPSKGSLTKVGPMTTTLHLQDPAEVLHKNGIDRTKDHNIFIANYLENGEVKSMKKMERVELNKGQVEVEEVNTSSCVVDPAGRLTSVERKEEPLVGLVRTFTTRAMRTYQGPGDSALAVGADEWRGEAAFTDPALLNHFKYETKLKNHY